MNTIKFFAQNHKETAQPAPVEPYLYIDPHAVDVDYTENTVSVKVYCNENWETHQQA